MSNYFIHIHLIFLHKKKMKTLQGQEYYIFVLFPIPLFFTLSAFATCFPMSCLCWRKCRMSASRNTKEWDPGTKNLFYTRNCNRKELRNDTNFCYWKYSHLGYLNKILMLKIIETIDCVLEDTLRATKGWREGIAGQTRGKVRVQSPRERKLLLPWWRWPIQAGLNFVS